MYPGSGVAGYAVRARRPVASFAARVAGNVWVPLVQVVTRDTWIDALSLFEHKRRCARHAGPFASRRASSTIGIITKLAGSRKIHRMEVVGT